MVSVQDCRVAPMLMTRPCASMGATCWRAVSATAPNTDPAAPHKKAPV
jgi:hypothetical protein